jgi:hypothetical protein
MIIEIENLLSTDKASEIEQFMLGPEINWIYNPRLSGVSVKQMFDNDPMIKDTDGFTHPFVEACNMVSPHVQIIKDIIQGLERNYGRNVIAVERARAVFVHKDPSFGDYYQVPHTDFTTPHMTMIYYVNDSDGDTVFFEEMYTGVDINKKTVSKRVTPKKNKCVLFDGLRYHTGSVPSKNNRIIININFYFK